MIFLDVWFRLYFIKSLEAVLVKAPHHTHEPVSVLVNRATWKEDSIIIFIEIHKCSGLKASLRTCRSLYWILLSYYVYLYHSVGRSWFQSKTTTITKTVNKQEKKSIFFCKCVSVCICVDSSSWHQASSSVILIFFKILILYYFTFKRNNNVYSVLQLYTLAPLKDKHSDTTTVIKEEVDLRGGRWTE